MEFIDKAQYTVICFVSIFSSQSLLTFTLLQNMVAYVVSKAYWQNGWTSLAQDNHSSPKVLTWHTAVSLRCTVPKSTVPGDNTSTHAHRVWSSLEQFTLLVHNIMVCPLNTLTTKTLLNNKNIFALFGRHIKLCFFFLQTNFCLTDNWSAVSSSLNVAYVMIPLLSHIVRFVWRHHYIKGLRLRGIQRLSCQIDYHFKKFRFWDQY